jgi:hypothetical protein
MVNQVGDYCNSLALRVARGQPVSQEQHAQLEQMCSQMTQLSTQVREVHTQSMDGQRSLWEASLMAKQDAAPIDDPLASLGSHSVDYPSLVYDGPFSDASDNPPKAITGPWLRYEDAEKAEFAARTATITVTAGEATPVTIAVSQSAPRELVPSLAIDPASLAFAVGETSKTVTLTATDFTLSTVNATDDAEWITTAYADGVLTVTVEPFESIQAAADRTGVITLTLPELAEPKTINVSQAFNLLPLNIAGTYAFTSGDFVTPNNGLTASAMSVLPTSLTIEKIGETNDFKVTGFPIYSTSYDVNGIVLTVDENNNVKFISRKAFGQTKGKDATSILIYIGGAEGSGDPASWKDKYYGNTTWFGMAPDYDTAAWDGVVALEGVSVDIAYDATAGTLTFPANGKTADDKICQLGFGLSTAIGTANYSMYKGAVLTKQ